MSLPLPADGAGPRYYGVYPAIVTRLVDPEGLGRIEVRFPWLGTEGDHDVRAWATLCSPYADEGQGLQILPDPGSQVVVAFEAGNPRRPYIVGSTWNGRTRPPARPTSANNLRVLHSRRNSRLEFDDSAQPKIRITLDSGHQITLDDTTQEITIRHATGGTVKLTPTAVEITGTAEVKVTAPTVKVNAAMSTFMGIVKCMTLIADTTVISPAYSPGVGNLP